MLPPPGIGPRRASGTSGRRFVADQAGAAEHGPHGQLETVVVEVAMEPDDDRVDAGVDAGIVVARDGHGPGGRHGLGDARPAADEHPFAGSQQRRGGGRRRHHVAGRIDADARQRGRVLGDA